MDKIINKFKYILETKDLIRLALKLDKDKSFREYAQFIEEELNVDKINQEYVKQQNLISDIQGINSYKECTKEEIYHIEKLLKDMTEGE